jgi:hypothetical protein
VDYWDYLGWKDPFGSKAHTARQKAYRPRLEIPNLVTPEILIDNAKARKGWDKVVAAETAKPARVRIDATLSTSERKLTATIRLSEPTKALPAKAVVRAVLFQHKAITSVPAGENKGKTLTEYFLVRILHDALPATKALTKKGVVATFDLPKGVRKSNLGLAVLVEDPEDMETLEAAAFDLPGRVAAPTLLVIRELTEERGAKVKQALAGPAKAKGLDLAVSVNDKLPKSKTKPVLLGFSAAGEPALKMAIRHKKKIAGLVLIAAPVTIDAAAAKALAKDVPVLLVYGRDDPVAAGNVGEAAGKVLSAATVDVKLEIFDAKDHFGVLTEGGKKVPGWIRTLR